MPQPRVSASIGYTVNMGDFESMRFDFGVEVDAKEGETAKAAMERAKGLVESVLSAEMVKAMEARNPNPQVIKRGSN